MGLLGVIRDVRWEQTIIVAEEAVLSVGERESSLLVRGHIGGANGRVHVDKGDSLGCLLLLVLDLCRCHESLAILCIIGGFFVDQNWAKLDRLLLLH